MGQRVREKNRKRRAERGLKEVSSGQWAASKKIDFKMERNKELFEFAGIRRKKQ
jgi:hypothetical protein